MMSLLRRIGLFLIVISLALILGAQEVFVSHSSGSYSSNIVGSSFWCWVIKPSNFTLVVPMPENTQWNVAIITLKDYRQDMNITSEARLRLTGTGRIIRTFEINESNVYLFFIFTTPNVSYGLAFSVLPTASSEELNYPIAGLLLGITITLLSFIPSVIRKIKLSR